MLPHRNVIAFDDFAILFLCTFLAQNRSRSDDKKDFVWSTTETNSRIASLSAFVAYLKDQKRCGTQIVFKI